MVQTKGTTNMGIWSALSRRCAFHSRTWSSLRATALVDKNLFGEGTRVEEGRTAQLSKCALDHAAEGADAEDGAVDKQVCLARATWMQRCLADAVRENMVTRMR